jgi:hypothetical protein
MALTVIDRRFTTPEPDRLWAVDATRIPCGQKVF